eukprot:gb/GFBE01081692.1/.p1 GENE.gb/GFBE01081692.1/~~gb/GFBE01081692.1/.p1  ORF type:complete len:337 (+),score=59.75 gb/GFBE01081692.1/:1-1011(+)
MTMLPALRGGTSKSSRNWLLAVLAFASCLRTHFSVSRGAPDVGSDAKQGCAGNPAFCGSRLPVAWSSRAAFLGRNARTSAAEVDTLFFDIDDTLYPASSGLSDHRMQNVTVRFMVEHLGFATDQEALHVWTEYIQRYHSTLKGLTVATEEGRLPKPFRQEDLGKFWADNCEFERFIGQDLQLVDMLGTLQQEAGFKLVAFTNAPRLYALRVLEVLGVSSLFPDDHVFAVEDVMPACKPEAEAFKRVLDSVGASPERSVMFEDSMKNVRACKALGMHTVLVKEHAGDLEGEANLLADVPQPDDPAVGAVVSRVTDTKGVIPQLWKGQFSKPSSKPGK